VKKLLQADDLILLNLFGKLDLGTKKWVESLQNSFEIDSYGLYYKHMTIVNDDSSIVNEWSSKLIDNARVIIYYRNMFIIQATGLMLV